MKRQIQHRGIAACALGAVLLASACGKGEKSAETADKSRHDAAETAQHAAKGRTIVVEASSDAEGNYFKPAEIEAHRGDVIRFTLKAGVHNINFVADSNPGKTGLPAASDMLQLPGQTYDLPVTLAKGRYYFQCDPHAALGMKGHLTVED